MWDDIRIVCERMSENLHSGALIGSRSRIRLVDAQNETRRVVQFVMVELRREKGGVEG